MNTHWILEAIPGSRLASGTPRARRNLGAFRLRTATCFDLCIFAKTRGAARQLQARDAKGKETYCPQETSGLQQNCRLLTPRLPRVHKVETGEVGQELANNNVKDISQRWSHVCWTELATSSHFPFFVGSRTVVSRCPIHSFKSSRFSHKPCHRWGL